MLDQDENLRNAILEKKALLAHKESILSRPPITKDSSGRPCKESQGSRIRLHEDCQHLRQTIAEQEREMLLRQYHRSIDPLTRNVVAQAAIAQQLAERGFYVQSMGESTAAEVRSETHLSSATASLVSAAAALTEKTDHEESAGPPNSFVRSESGEVWLISFGGKTIHLTASVGLRYLQELIRRAGHSISAGQLISLIAQGETRSPSDVNASVRNLTQEMRQVVLRRGGPDVGCDAG